VNKKNIFVGFASILFQISWVHLTYPLYVMVNYCRPLFLNNEFPSDISLNLQVVDEGFFVV
jgi:hypothetical protein